MTERLTAGELSQKAFADNTKYNALEVGHAMTENQILEKELRQCIENHKNIILEDEFCIVMLWATDPIIKNLRRRKFYAWPYLPNPRPNQTVFLYNKIKDDIVKRLWSLPCDIVMWQLSELSFVLPKYLTMKRWSDYFFHGWIPKDIFVKNMDPITCINQPYFLETQWINTTPSHFFNKIRHESNISMPSEHEYMHLYREELIKAGCKLPEPDTTYPFDFDKISIKKVVDTQDVSIEQDSLSRLAKT